MERYDLSDILNAIFNDAQLQEQVKTQPYSEAEPTPKNQQRQQSKEAAELLKTAQQYEEQAKALREQAFKVDNKLKFKSDPHQIPCVKYNNKVVRFTRERDAQLYVKFLEENGINVENIEIFNIEVELEPKFWR